VPDRIEELTCELVDRCAGVPGVTTVAVFGSSTTAAAGRRDEWSDLDFAVFAEPDARERIAREWPFLPSPDDVVLAAREHGSAGVVLYRDGTVAEFGAGVPWPITDASCEVLLGGADIVAAEPPGPDSASNAIRLFLAKLLIGVGRVRRGEVASGGRMIRGEAAAALASAIRARFSSEAGVEHSPFDPLRRFEAAYPVVGSRLAAASELPAEAAARGLFDLALDELRPGWPEWPGAAAAVVQRRLGWTT
jgi:hypothetical protein